MTLLTELISTEENISHQKNLSITANELKLLEKIANDQDWLITEIRIKMANATLTVTKYLTVKSKS